MIEIIHMMLLKCICDSCGYGIVKCICDSCGCMSDSYSQICALDPCGISKKTRSENKRKEKKKKVKKIKEM